MYKKKYNEKGVLSNPILKDQPYINKGPNRAERRMRERPFNNSGKPAVIVTRIGTTDKGHAVFQKYAKKLQVNNRRTIVHFVNR